jgi:hypothetical protein
MSGNVPYVIEKARTQGEFVFEYALCADCVMRLLHEYSEESLERMRRFVQNEPGLEDAVVIDQLLWSLGQPTEDGLGAPASPDAEAVDHCHRCGRRGADYDEEHTVMGLLVGTRLAMNVSTICSPCAQGMEEILSRKTRDVHEDFVRRTFPGVPAGLDLPVGLLGTF